VGSSAPDSLDSSLASLEYSSSAASLASTPLRAPPPKAFATPTGLRSGGDSGLQGSSSLLEGVSVAQSVAEGQSLNTLLVGTGDAPSRNGSTVAAGAETLVAAVAGSSRRELALLARSLASRRLPTALVVDAHAAPVAWFPGSDDEHRSLVGWHRNHAATDAMEEEGRSLTALTLSRGDALATQRKRAAQKAFQGAERERQARAAAKATSGVGSKQEIERLEEIDVELAALAEKRAVVFAKQRAGVAARQVAAQEAARRVDVFRAQRKALEASGALDAPNRPFKGQHLHHPLPLGTPFAYRAKDLFKTFQDDEVY
jgi:hypothetical protein